MYTVIEGGVTAAAGFQTASTAAGIKYKNRKDMAMIYSEKPCKAAGTFTTNIVKAAPVKWDQKIVKESEYAQAVVINAGIAKSKGEGKRLIEQGGITVNDEKITDVFAAVERTAFDGEVILKKGKKIFKKLIVE